MSAKISLLELPIYIQKLVEERQQHADALAHIEHILGGVSAALGRASASPNGKKVVVAPAATQAPAVKGKKRRRGRSNFALSAEESVLSFVTQQKNSTSGEINQHLLGEGRSKGAINALTKLVKERKLKRTPIKGERGSRYSLI